MKYLAIYRKSLRNNKNLSSSRTNLRLQNGNQVLIMFNQIFSTEKNSEIVLSNYKPYNKSARESIERCIIKTDPEVEVKHMTSPIVLPQIAKEVTLKVRINLFKVLTSYFN